MLGSERTKETKTAEELVAMIREDLSNVDGCPKRGIVVTVYGIQSWSRLSEQKFRVDKWNLCRG